MLDEIKELFLITPKLAMSFSEEELINRIRWMVQCCDNAKGHSGESFYLNNLATLRAERLRRR